MLQLSDGHRILISAPLLLTLRTFLRLGTWRCLPCHLLGTDDGSRQLELSQFVVTSAARVRKQLCVMSGLMASQAALLSRLERIRNRDKSPPQEQALPPTENVMGRLMSALSRLHMPSLYARVRCNRSFETAASLNSLRPESFREPCRRAARRACRMPYTLNKANDIPQTDEDESRAQAGQDVSCEHVRCRRLAGQSLW